MKNLSTKYIHLILLKYFASLIKIRSLVSWNIEELEIWTNPLKWVIINFNANSAIFQLYHGENMPLFNEMMMRSGLH
jgi:hypothetical protein